MPPSQTSLRAKVLKKARLVVIKYGDELIYDPLPVVVILLDIVMAPSGSILCPKL